MAKAGKRIDGLRKDTPLDEAARLMLRTRLDAICIYIEQAADSGAEVDTETIHQLRVTSRRARAVVEALNPFLPKKDRNAMRKRLRRIRRAAGEARECDVHTQFLREMRDRIPLQSRAAVDYLIGWLEQESVRARTRLASQIRKHAHGRFYLRCAQTMDAIDIDGAEHIDTLPELADETITRLVGRLEALDAPSPDDIESMHRIRIAAKKLRYAVEIFRPCLGDDSRKAFNKEMRALQDALGAANDLASALELISTRHEHLKRHCSQKQDEAPPSDVMQGMAWIETKITDELRSRMEQINRDWPAMRSRLCSLGLAMAAHSGGDDSASQMQPDSSGFGKTPKTRRIAAIDVGTNTIRLIVAESFIDGGYRIIDDEKDVARLGRGLASTGRIEEDTMQDAAQTIARMKSIAEGYGVEMIRVAGTCVVREATNSEEFLRLVREVSGLEMQVIDAEEEGRLAQISVARSFDLHSLPAAVVDIGGGSTEIVLSSGGVIEQIYPLPLGAVRLTERFGGPEEAGGRRFKEMRKAIRDELRDVVGETPFIPKVVIGSGGTYTTMAEMSIREQESEPSAGSATVRGHEMSLEQVRRQLDRLREVDLEDRSDIPGLSQDRADIIVAGVAIAESVMSHMGVHWLRVHDKGIRDGLLLSMAREMRQLEGVATPLPVQRQRSVWKFARTCDYDRRHCEHVARLAGSVFDQLAAHFGSDADSWAGPTNRELLDAGTILHDVGYHINYSKHHHHSYHLIVHSDLRGFSQREIEIIANLARYHRRAEPKLKHPTFARLTDEDQELVLKLAAILRVADGLDRTHMRKVRNVELRIADGQATFILDAEDDPGVEIWGAERKADYFERVFGLKPVFVWGKADGESATSKPVDSASS